MLVVTVCSCVHRDTALGVKADVDEMLSGFGPVENSVATLEDRLRESLDAKDTLTDRLAKVRRETTLSIATLVATDGITVGCSVCR